MKRLTLALLLWFLFAIPTSADTGPFYFPIVYRDLHPCQEVDKVGDFKVIVPASTTNKVLNPSAEIAGNFTAEAGTTVTRVTTFQHYGLYSYHVETNANNEGIRFTLSALANAIHYVTVRVRGTLPPAWDWSLDSGGPFAAPTLLEQIDSDWALYGLQFSAANSGSSVTLFIHQNGTGSGDFYLDGVQVEENTTWTTYCDGTQPGCEWNGTPHGSSSTRSPESRAGGRVYDLEDDYGLHITGMSGTGTAPQELFSDSYSQLPGGELNAIKTNSRVFTLTGLISESTEAEFYQVKQTLESLFDPEAYPEDENGPQPIRLRFTGAAVHKEIAVHYEGGLETNITADDPCAWEKVAVRFLADDPYWYEIGESAALLDTEDSATFQTIAGRLRSTGQWSALGPPNASGAYTSVYALVEDDTYLYVGGSFSNFDNIAAADNIVRYNKLTGAWSAIDAGLNGVVWALALAPNGDLYVGGEFTNASGVAAADYLARLPAGGTAFVAVGVPSTGAAAINSVRALAFDFIGNLYIGGAFLNWNDIANADRIVMWNGSAYSALSTGMNNSVFALAVGSGNIIYIGGSFTTAGGATNNYITSWTGSAFVALGSGMDDNVLALIFDSKGLLYIGGEFLTAGGISANYICIYNGSTFIPLADGPGDVVNSISIGQDGIVYIGGFFSDEIALTDRIVSWNGYTYTHLSIDLPGAPIVYVVMASKYADPVVKHKYNFFFGFNATGAGSYGGLATASNSGTAPAYPRIYFTRSGGTTATVQSLRNERTGKELLFNYSLLSGETLTIDLTPTKKSISSSFYGSRQDAVLPNSDFGDWSLLTGSNDITAFVLTSGSPTVTGYMLWKRQFKSQN